MEQYKKLSVETIEGGAILKKLDYQLSQAVSNCCDINTLVNAKRVVVLKIAMKPNNSRDTIDLDYEINAKFPCDAPGSDIIQVAPSSGEGYVQAAQMTLAEMIHNQAAINLETDEEPIYDIKTGEVK